MSEEFGVPAQLVSGALALNSRLQHQSLYLIDSCYANWLSKGKASGGFWKTCLRFKRDRVEIVVKIWCKCKS